MTTEVIVHIRADSLAELRDQLQKALDDMGWAPLPVAQAEEANQFEPLPEALVEQVQQRREALAAEKPRRTRKVKEEAPAAPAEDPTSSAPAPTADVSKNDAPAGEAGAGSDAATATEPSPSTPPATSSPPASAAPTHEQAKAAAEEWLSQHPDGREAGKKEIRGMLATYGVQRIAELPPGQIQSFLDDLSGGDV